MNTTITKQQIEEVLIGHLKKGNNYIDIQNCAAELLQLIESDKPQQTEPQPEIWECVDDTTPDWGLSTNRRDLDGIKKGDRRVFKELCDIEPGIKFIGGQYWHDITKFKRVTT